jgi:hypothetical protein
LVAALGVRIQTPLKNTKWAISPGVGQHTLARPPKNNKNIFKVGTAIAQFSSSSEITFGVVYLYERTFSQNCFIIICHPSCIGGGLGFAGI